MIEGKDQFYGKAEEALKSRGYQYYSEQDIIGIGSAHSSKPDYIAVKGDMVVIGEIKSPREGPKSAMWRQIQRGDSEEFKAVRLDVSKREETGKLPNLPPEDLIPNSERYVVGPVSLDRFFPGLAPSLAAFHLGAEAQIGHYSTPKGPLLLAIFNYPTPNMARERVAEFQKISGAMVKRAGPLVAMTLNPPDADAAEKILSRVKYETNITWNEKVPENEVRNTARLVLNIFVFSGILIALAATAGVLFGGYRFLFRKLHKGEDPEAMITLHLEGK